jgi:hypothetical protein
VRNRGKLFIPRRAHNARLYDALTPSPGTSGEGGGEGDLGLRCGLVLEITLTPTLSRSTGRGSSGEAATRVMKPFLIVASVLFACTAFAADLTPATGPTTNPATQQSTSLAATTAPSTAPSQSAFLTPTTQPQISGAINPATLPATEPTTDPSTAPVATTLPTTQPQSARALTPATLPATQPTTTPTTIPVATTGPTTQPLVSPAGPAANVGAYSPSGSSSYGSPQPILPRDYFILAVRSIFQKGSHVTRGFDIPTHSAPLASTTSQASSSAASSAAASAAPEESLVYEGSMETGNQFLAFVEDRSAGKMLMLQSGAKIARGKIGDISLDTLDYAVDGAVLHVQVGQNLRGEAAAAASSDGSTPTASSGSGTTQPSGTAASGDTSAAPPSGSSGGGANDILERLRRRRQQELQGK